MLDFPLMIHVQAKLPIVNIIQPQSNKFATGVESEATGVSKLNDSPALGSCVLKVSQLSVDRYP